MNLAANALNLKTKFDTAYIVDVLRKHLEKHQAEYSVAMTVYENDIEGLLDSLTDECKKLMGVYGAELDLTIAAPLSTVSTAYNKLVSLKKPIDATKMYEGYINILSQSQEKTLELEISDADSIINDSWDWAVQAKMSNSFYNSRSQ